MAPLSLSPLFPGLQPGRGPDDHQAHTGPYRLVRPKPWPARPAAWRSTDRRAPPVSGLPGSLLSTSHSRSTHQAIDRTPLRPHRRPTTVTQCVLALPGQLPSPLLHLIPHFPALRTQARTQSSDLWRGLAPPRRGATWRLADERWPGAFGPGASPPTLSLALALPSTVAWKQRPSFACSHQRACASQGEALSVTRPLRPPRLWVTQARTAQRNISRGILHKMRLDGRAKRLGLPYGGCYGFHSDPPARNKANKRGARRRSPWVDGVVIAGSVWTCRTAARVSSS